MITEEYLMIKTCVLKVNIHCDGCKQEVKKILRKIEGVYTTNIDSNLGKVTVKGDLDPDILIKKLRKKGKHADLWDAPKINNNNLNNQLKNLHINNLNGGGNTICNNQGNTQPLVDGVRGKSSKVQQHEQYRAVQDQKLPFNKNQLNKKHVTFTVPYNDLVDDDELDDDDDDDYDEEDDDEDEVIDDTSLNKMKSIIGSGHGSGGGPKVTNMMVNKNTNGQNAHQLTKNSARGGNLSGGAKVGPSNVRNPTQMDIKGASGNGNNNGGKQIQGGAEGNKNCGGNTQGAGCKNGNYNNGGGTFDARNEKKNKANGPEKGHGLNNVPQGNHNMMTINGASGGQKKSMSMGQMGHMNNPLMCQTSNIASLHGLQESSMNGGGSGGAGSSEGPGLDQMPGNYKQLMMMNQQHSNGNELSQPMMDGPTPPLFNYSPPMPYPCHDTHAPPPTKRADEYTMFSDEDTKSCIVM